MVAQHLSIDDQYRGSGGLGSDLAFSSLVLSPYGVFTCCDSVG